jgi:hypothetical protein
VSIESRLFALILTLLLSTVAGAANPNKPDPKAVAAQQQPPIQIINGGNLPQATSPPAILKSDDQTHANELYKALAETQSESAKAAIEASKSGVEHIKDLLSVFSLIFAVAAGVIGILGFREYRAWQRLFLNAKARANRIGKLHRESVAKLHEMEEQQQRHLNESMELQRLEFEMLTLRFRFEQYYAKKHGDRPLDVAILMRELEKLYAETAGLEGGKRIRSWAAGALSFVLSDEGKYAKAIELGEDAYANNVAGLPDRAFNIACYASRLWRQTKDDPQMLAKCAEWLKLAIEEDPTARADVLTDDDFSETREQPAIAALLIQPVPTKGS